MKKKESMVNTETSDSVRQYDNTDAAHDRSVT